MCGAGEDIFRQPVGVRAPYSNLTGRAVGSSGIHENDMLEAGPAIHQREALAALLCDFKTGDFDAKGFDDERMQTARDKKTSRVVPAIEVAAADNAKGHDAKGHVYSRSRCRRRKWVAQEMQGS